MQMEYLAKLGQTQEQPNQRRSNRNHKNSHKLKTQSIRVHTVQLCVFANRLASACMQY